MILLNFNGKIKGDSQIDAHKDWITVSSIQFGVGRAISVTAGGRDRDTSNPAFSEITVSKPTDLASADLFMQAICGKSLEKAEIHFIQTSGADSKSQTYLKVELTDPIISSYSTQSGGERPSESFSVNFTKISYQYDSFSGETVKTGTAKKWDLMSNSTF